ncbi:uncharacterized protein LOC141900556 [Tubulanus polymorphus]|uniref:uncharacterized protein LOC141900556 n=1 Tax=Tubulanus polymorphus TaxID=672921 RepID=UPI003DA3D804
MKVTQFLIGTLSTVMLALMAFTRGAPVKSCKMPKPADLAAYLQKLSQSAEPGFFAMASSDQIPATAQSPFATSIPVTTEKPQCPNTMASGAEPDVAKRSVCPWVPVVDTNSTRYPEKIVKARCVCDKCLSGGNNLARCEHILMMMTVLEKVGCENGIWKYRSTQIQVPVGCACAVQRTASVSNVILGGLFNSH